jgi:8-oxo-dGTP diphosphatase
MAQRRRPSKLEHDGNAPTREDGRVHIEVHVAGICVRQQNGHWEVLIAKRNSKRSLYAGKWECGGGQVRKGEDFEDALKRQFFEEFGIEVEVGHILEGYSIPVPPRGKIPGVRYLCYATEGRVRLNKREFTTFRWVRFPVPKLPWIEGVKRMLDVVAAEFQVDAQHTGGKPQPIRKPVGSERRGLRVVPRTDRKTIK